MCVQASEELHVLLETPVRNQSKEIGVCASVSRFTCVTGTPAAADVSVAQCQFSTADRFFAGVGTCGSSDCSLYTTNGMLQTGFRSVDTNRCVYKGPKSHNMTTVPTGNREHAYLSGGF
ncbi:hypothetical protein AVEN_170235-1 [Araneus ventricosus]|uniref:Uncharacterized protein n=1 Tax=Araneus ventricosus TaxID=182803 RepID=A0A4Y2KCU2_ARAVE|nr:hypothetical protein AVEN_170235-1 [Araneus ventricosus]